MTRGVVERAFEIASSNHVRVYIDNGLATPFGLTKRNAYCWRVSQDVYAALVKHVGFGPDHCPPAATLLGDPLRVDETLPPNSMLHEPSVVRTVVSADPA